MKNFNKGFTLIELLVVIAIVGVLAGVILPNLTSTRLKGVDTAIIANINSARNQASIYFEDNNGSYTGVCDVTALPNGTRTINDNLKGAQSAWGTTTQPLNIALGVAGAGDLFSCHENGVAFAIEVPLKLSTVASPKMYCLDSTTNNGGQKATTIGAGSILCN